MKITRNLLLTSVALALGLSAAPAKSSQVSKKESHDNKNHAQSAAVEENRWKRGTEGHRPQDLNGDGVITRNEWPGSDESFRHLDRDGDGALTKKDRTIDAEGSAKPMYDRPVNDYRKPKK